MTGLLGPWNSARHRRESLATRAAASVRSCTRQGSEGASRVASWRWRDTLAIEGLDHERSARDCRTPATRCDKGLPGCASQGEQGPLATRKGGTQKDSSSLLHDSQGKFIGARRSPRWERRLVRRIAGAWPGTRSEVAATLGKAGEAAGGDSASASGAHLNESREALWISSFL